MARYPPRRPQGDNGADMGFHVKQLSLWITSVDNMVKPQRRRTRRKTYSRCELRWRGEALHTWGKTGTQHLDRVSVVSENAAPLPDFTRWPSFPFEGDMRVKQLMEPVDVEPPRHGEDVTDCVACNTPDEAYIWVSERWRVRAMDRPTGLPMVLILESRSHLDLGDLPNLLAAELGVMTVRLERAVRSLEGVARVHVNRWGDGSAHLHLWFLARPYGRLQLRGTFLSLWDDILPEIPEHQWRENLAHVAAWLAEFGGRSLAEPPHIQWQSPSTVGDVDTDPGATDLADTGGRETDPVESVAGETDVNVNRTATSESTIEHPAAEEVGPEQAGQRRTPGALGGQAKEVDGSSEADLAAKPTVDLRDRRRDGSPAGSPS